MRAKRDAATLVGIAAILVTTLFLMVWVWAAPQVDVGRTLPGPIPTWWLNGDPAPGS